MSKTIRSRLLQKNEARLVQAKCRADLVEKTLAQMQKDNITWRELLEASFHTYIEESASKKSKADDAA